MNKSDNPDDTTSIKSKSFYGGYGPAAGVDFSAINDLVSPFSKATSSTIVEGGSEIGGSASMVENKDGGGNGHLVRDRSYDDDMSANMSTYSVSSPTPSRSGTGKGRGTDRDRSGTVTSTTSANHQGQKFSSASTNSLLLPPSVPYRDLTAAVVRGCFHLLLSGGKKRQATKKWVLMCAELLLPLCLFVDAIDVGETDTRGLLSGSQNQGLRTIGSKDSSSGASDIGLLSRSLPSSSSGSGSSVPSDTSKEKNRVKHQLADVERAFADVLLPYWSAPQCKQSRLVLEQVIAASIQCIILLSVRHIFSRRLDGKIRPPIGRTTMAKSTTTDTASSMTVSSMLGTLITRHTTLLSTRLYTPSPP